MWTVVYTAQDKDIVTNLKRNLLDVNILVKVICAANESKFDILVPYTEVEQAHNVLIDLAF